MGVFNVRGFRRLFCHIEDFRVEKPCGNCFYNAHLSTWILGSAFEMYWQILLQIFHLNKWDQNEISASKSVVGT